MRNLCDDNARIGAGTGLSEAPPADRREIVACRLTRGEAAQIEALLRLLHETGLPVESDRMARELSLHAALVPPRLRRLLLDLRGGLLPCAAVLVRGFAVDDAAIGASPQRWDHRWEAPETRREELYQGLISAVAGELLAWATQEDGRMFRHVVPMREAERAQIGSSSLVQLEVHTEEAHSPLRPELLSLLCLRNHERAATGVCSAARVDLPDALKAALFEPRFIIHPDPSHSVAFNASYEGRLSEGQRRRSAELYRDPGPAPIFTGSWSDPEIRIDPPYMSTVPGDALAAEALATLCDRLAANIEAVVLEPGDLLLIDNARCVHDRQPFVPLYSAAQRWLRRCQLTTDLRRSAAVRRTPSARTIF